MKHSGEEIGELLNPKAKNCKTTTTHKWCKHCKRWLAHKNFHKAKSARCGMKSRCRECVKATRPTQHKRKQNVERYGITLEDYDRMFEEQGGKCAICGSTDFGSSHNRHFAVDHDHETGKVRGLLCHRCNVGLGWFKDNTSFLASAIKYLEENK